MSDVPMIPALIVEDAPARSRSAWLDWVSTVDHKRIGLLYLFTSLFFFCVGGIEALLMRIQLAWPGNTFLSPDMYNQIFTMHGTTMVFLVVVPLLLGFANYLTPLMIGASDMALPRLNAFSFWVFLFGGFLLYFSFVSGHAPAAGWFSYAPLSEKGYSIAFRAGLLGSRAAGDRFRDHRHGNQFDRHDRHAADGRDVDPQIAPVRVDGLRQFIPDHLRPAGPECLSCDAAGGPAVELPLLHCNWAAAHRFSGSTFSGPSVIRRSTS